jgi:hypothetical protein
MFFASKPRKAILGAYPEVCAVGNKKTLGLIVKFYGKKFSSMEDLISKVKNYITFYNDKGFKKD